MKRFILTMDEVTLLLGIASTLSPDNYTDEDVKVMIIRAKALRDSAVDKREDFQLTVMQ